MAAMWEQFLREGAILASREGDISVAIGPLTWSETATSCSFYAPDFFLQTKKPFFQGAKLLRMKREEFTTQFSPTILKPHQWEFGSFSLFKEQFQTVQEKIRKGLLTKAVLYSTTHTEEPITSHNLSTIFSTPIPPNLALFGFWNEEEGMIGLTPERLFQKKGNKIETEALAGTMSSSHRTKQDFLDDPKEQKEHAIVVKGIQEALSPYGKVRIGEPELLDLGALVHRRTVISTEAAVSVEELIHALHPTPALGAAPKEPGVSFLQGIDKIVPRRRYGAPFGWVDGDSAELVVAIRAVQWNKSGSQILAGAGIVKESLLEQEWKEIERKTKSIIKGLFLGN